MGDDTSELAKRAADRSSLTTDLPAARHDRSRLAAFVSDAQTEMALREGLADLLTSGGDFHRGGLHHAITALRRMPSPLALIVDISTEESPLAQLARLSEVVEPSVQVLVVGQINNLDFYRELTRGLGVLEYLPKPITRDSVRRHFLPLLSDKPIPAESIATGRLITVTGARGGVGTTTIAANLAWHLGVTAQRHTALLDPDLQLGSAAMLLDTPTGRGLRIALEEPERVDALFIERAAQPAAERLHVLAGEVRLGDRVNYANGCAKALVSAMCGRYAVVVADTPMRPLPLFRDLLDLAHQRVVVTLPTLSSLRDTRRLLQLPPGPEQPGRPLVVLNRAGMRGGLNRKQVEETLEMKPDLVIPDLPRLVEQAASMGQAMADKRNPFARAIADLARQTAFVRLLESPLGVQGGPAPRRWWRLFR